MGRLQIIQTRLGICAIGARVLGSDEAKTRVQRRENRIHVVRGGLSHRGGEDRKPIAASPLIAIFVGLGDHFTEAFVSEEEL